MFIEKIAQLAATDTVGFIKKKAALDPALANALGLGGIGAMTGGVLGGLGGLIDPGETEETETDAEGNKIVKRKPKNRLTAALTGGLGGALGGGLLGGAVGGLGTEALRFIPKVQNAIHRNQSSNPVSGTLNTLGANIQDTIWDKLNRNQQHEIMAQKIPFAYNNPLSMKANEVFDILKKYVGEGK